MLRHARNLPNPVRMKQDTTNKNTLKIKPCLEIWSVRLNKSKFINLLRRTLKQQQMRSSEKTLKNLKFMQYLLPIMFMNLINNRCHMYQRRPHPLININNKRKKLIYPCSTLEINRLRCNRTIHIIMEDPLFPSSQIQSEETRIIFNLMHQNSTLCRVQKKMVEHQTRRTQETKR